MGTNPIWLSLNKKQKLPHKDRPAGRTPCDHRGRDQTDVNADQGAPRIEALHQRHEEISISQEAMPC